jgi:RDD family protein
MRRARILACLLDALVSIALADAAALALTATLWIWLPGARWLTAWVWAGAGACAIVVFLLRDASGGRARRWLALEAVDREGRPPGPAGSILRNLPLVVPVWNLWDAWPLLSDGAAQRRTDRARGIRVVASA